MYLSTCHISIIYDGAFRTRISAKKLHHKRLIESEIAFEVTHQKQPSMGVLIKRCSENRLHTYRKTPMLKRNFNKIAKQLY